MDKKDKELIQKIKAGDEIALSELFLKYAPMVNTVCKKYVIKTLERKDLVQEAFLICYQTVMVFDFERTDNFGAFYKMNLINRFRTMFRLSFAYRRLSNLYSVSFDDYKNTIKAMHTGEYMITNIDFEEYLDNLSKLETKVLKYYMNDIDNGLAEHNKSVISTAKKRAKKKLVEHLFDR